MFKLYGNNNGMQLLDVSHDEMDIVETIGSYIGILDEIDYIVIDSDEKSDDVKEVIKNYNDYLGYKHSVYNKKNDNCDLEKSLRECRIEDIGFKKLRKIKKYDRI